jgi:hypothetical protein
MSLGSIMRGISECGCALVRVVPGCGCALVRVVPGCGCAVASLKVRSCQLWFYKDRNTSKYSEAVKLILQRILNQEVIRTSDSNYHLVEKLILQMPSENRQPLFSKDEEKKRNIQRLIDEKFRVVDATSGEDLIFSISARQINPPNPNISYFICIRPDLEVTDLERLVAKEAYKILNEYSVDKERCRGGSSIIGALTACYFGCPFPAFLYTTAASDHASGCCYDSLFGSAADSFAAKHSSAIMDKKA